MSRYEGKQVFKQSCLEKEKLSETRDSGSKHQKSVGWSVGWLHFKAGATPWQPSQNMAAMPFYSTEMSPKSDNNSCD